MQNNKIILIALIALIALGLGYLAIKQFSQPTGRVNVSVSSVNPVHLVTPADLPYQLCFYKEFSTDRGFKDITSLKMNIVADHISGELRILPAEKDSKVGTFDGLIIETNSATRERTADVVWNSLGEGMQVKEELILKMNREADGSFNSARIGFGEMIPKADGTYVYKNKNNLSYIEVPKTDCGIPQ